MNVQDISCQNETQNKKGEINLFLSSLKVIATILVVYIHSANIIGYAGFDTLPNVLRPVDFLSRAAVPIFFAVSAYLVFSKPFNYKRNLVKKCKSLLMPYLLLIAFYICFEIIGNYILPNIFADVRTWNALTWIKAIFGIPFVCGPIYEPLWYIRDLFILNLIIPFLRQILEKSPLLILTGGGNYMV